MIRIAHASHASSPCQLATSTLGSLAYLPAPFKYHLPTFAGVAGYLIDTLLQQLRCARRPRSSAYNTFFPPSLVRENCSRKVALPSVSSSGSSFLPSPPRKQIQRLSVNTGVARRFRRINLKFSRIEKVEQLGILSHATVAKIMNFI